MRIDALRLRGFRNISEMDFLPGPGANVIYGDNAQGKTNLLEAIWLFSGARSFRGAKEAEFKGFGCNRTSLELTFFADDRVQTASIVYASERKAVYLNEIKQENVSALAGAFCTVVFSPDDLSLVKDGPEKRRRMIDASLCQAYPKYSKAVSAYEKILHQRNRLLKDIPQHAFLLDTLDAWDEGLVNWGAYLIRMRARYIKRLAELAGEIYTGISLGREEFSMRYLPSIGGESSEQWAQEEAAERLAHALKRSRAEDVRFGSTTVGPQRDDIAIEVAGRSARSFGSQGQQRSCILALKLAECRILEERFGEPPVILLDDVMSELDEGRRAYLLNQLGGRQVLITCCDASAFSTLENGRVFHLHAGQIV